MNLVSTIIVVKDNPPHLFESIHSVHAFSSEILIADIGMDPELKKQLLAKYKINIVQIKEPVPYVELIREKLKSQAKNEYILLLDPDEIVTKDLIDLLTSKIGMHDYVKIPRKNIIFGKWIQHSRWWPDYQVRFFKKTSVVWPTEIHKQPEVFGKGITLEPNEDIALIHYNYESIDEYLQKAMRYAKSEANTYVKNNTQLTLKDTIRLSISEFISRFFADKGYKDGIRGFILSIFQMFYPLLVYFYYLEYAKYDTRMTENELIVDSTHFFARLHKESLFWKNKTTPTTIKEKVIEKLTD